MNSLKSWLNFVNKSFLADKAQLMKLNIMKMLTSFYVDQNLGIIAKTC